MRSAFKMDLDPVVASLDGRRALVFVSEFASSRLARRLWGLGISRSELPEVALRYVLSHPAVSTVIPGMRSVRNVDRNAAIGDGEGLPEDRLAALKAHRWDRAAT